MALGLALAGQTAQQAPPAAAQTAQGSPSYVPELAKPGFPGWGQAVPAPQRDAAPAPPLGKPTDWPSPWGGDPGGSKFSTLNQINAENVNNLTVAWTYDTGYSTNDQYQHSPSSSATSCTCRSRTARTSSRCRRIRARNSGRPRSRTFRESRRPPQNRRGPAYWPGTATVPPRVVVLTTNGFLVQLEAKTGKLVKGPAGVINLAVGVMEKFGSQPLLHPHAAGHLQEPRRSSPPAPANRGGTAFLAIRGAFDLITGKEVWRFHAVPYAGDVNFGTWGMDGWQDRRGPGVWVPMCGRSGERSRVRAVRQPDRPELRQQPARDKPLFRLARRASGLYRQARLVPAVDAPRCLRLGRQRQPSLIEVVKDGKRIPVVAQTSKQGLLFLFDRFTGEPLFGMEERPVPRFDAPGDYTWPTAPFPIKPTGRSRESMTRRRSARSRRRRRSTARNSSTSP